MLLYFKYLPLSKRYYRKFDFFDCVFKIFFQDQPKKKVSFATIIEEQLPLCNQGLLLIQCNENLEKCSENGIKEEMSSSISEQITGVIEDLDLCSNTEDTRLFKCLNLSIKEVLFSLSNDNEGLRVKDYLVLRERLFELEKKLADSDFILNYGYNCLKDVLLTQIRVSKLDMDLKVYIDSEEEINLNRLITTILDVEKYLKGTEFLNIFITYKNQLFSKETLEKINNDLKAFEREPLLKGNENIKQITRNIITSFEMLINGLFISDFS